MVGRRMYCFERQFVGDCRAVSVQGGMAGAVLLLAGLGCQPEMTCAEDGAPCGGDPTGTWNVVNACRDPVFAQPVPPTYQGQPVQMARQPSPVLESSDWCSAVFLGVSASASFTFPHDTLSVSGGQLVYVSDGPQQGSYQGSIDTTGSGSVDLSATCLARSGVPLTCRMVRDALVALAAVKPARPGMTCSDSPSQVSCQFYYSYQNIACADDSQGGCVCTYDVSFAGALSGRWTASGGVLTHSDASKMLPTQADYCVGSSGNSLTLWGHDRTSILDQTGVRTLMLQRMH
jgi:hypothetical protein